MGAQTQLDYTSTINNHKISQYLNIPEGWEIQNEDFNNAVIIKSNSTDEAIISTYVIEADMRYDSIESIIKFELDSYREFASDRFEVKNMSPITIDDGKSIAIVKYVTGAADAAYQAVAYIPESKLVYVIIYGTNSHKFFTENLSDFEKIVQSYKVDRERIWMVTKNTFY
jgi:hypothetical protein